ncbi:YceI family protein [Microvirgula aerodenitrificans]|uniref:YceI family protein n=1 Tax=Microvirgula aerodenitrificans TaxID=57480 RepID=UPI00248D85DC|nr:YceI family protein [Microvirgula aerodenitrificans]
MRRTLLPLVVAVALVAPLTQAQAPVSNKSRIGFVFKQFNVPVEGQFSAFKGDITFDPAKPEAGHVDLTLDINSLHLPSKEATGEARKKEWFNAAGFPTARFVSTQIKSLGGGRYQADGKLTIKGITRDASAPLTLREEGPLRIADGALTIRRLDFNIGEGSWRDTDTVANDVQIKFRVALPK